MTEAPASTPASAVAKAPLTDKRLRERERAAAERAATERAALMGELTEALAEAATVRDVVDTVASGCCPRSARPGCSCIPWRATIVSVCLWALARAWPATA
ncbi:hypothetical protein [Streptomyces collinus]|uniref:hypothetical protein n=1 Tax=Streptomyces collinus TaxID=42684 RepID=UPI0033CD50E6